MRCLRKNLSIFLFLLFTGLLLSAGDAALPVTRSVCLLKSPKGSGSGFFASFAGMDVVITNNHVILGLEEVRICDINGGEYEYDKVYCSPERDLAVIPVKRTNHDTMPNLKIFGNPDMLKPGAAVSAYGDSLGDGVIVEVKGVFQGIGPRIIEVSAPFVPGNSGGPVIAKTSKEVIGVSTYCRIIRRSDLLTGSRFAPRSAYKPAVRRFATRIDNTGLDDFELVTREQIVMDQRKHAPFVQAYKYIEDVLSDWNDMKVKRIEDYFKSHPKFETGGKWYTTFLKKDAMEKWTDIMNVRDALRKYREGSFQDSSFSPRDVKAITEEENLRNVWREFSPSFTGKKKKPVVVKCPACDGFGKIKEKLSDREIRANAKKMRPPYKMVPCSICREKRTFTFRGNCEYWIAPPEFFVKTTEIIKPMPKKVLGFSVGGPVPDLDAVFDGFYSKKKRTLSRYGIFSVCRYKGCHGDRDAAETRFWFLGDTLMRIDLLYPVTDRTFIEKLYQDLVKEYGDDTPFYFNVIRKAYSWNEIRRLFLDRKGSPLLIEHAKAAYERDPFAMYCFPKKNRIRKIQFISDRDNIYYNGPADETNEPQFVCISFIHTLYEMCLSPDVRQTQQGSRFRSNEEP